MLRLGVTRIPKIRLEHMLFYDSRFDIEVDEHFFLKSMRLVTVRRSNNVAGLLSRACVPIEEGGSVCTDDRIKFHCNDNIDCF